MKGIIRWRSKARQDLIDIFRHLAREAKLQTAGRFLVQAEATFARLANGPHIGSRYEAEDHLLDQVHFLPISRFRKYLVFYLPRDDGIDVIRVLHGARDIPSILSDDFGIAGTSQ